MRTAFLLIVCLAAPLQDKGLRRIEWKLPPSKTALYPFLDKGGKPIKGQEFLLFGSELLRHSNRIVVDKYEDIPLSLVFQLPPEPFKSSAAWEFTATFFHEAGDAFGMLESFAGWGGLRPVQARGRYAVKSIQKKGDDEVAVIDGGFTFFEMRRENVNNQSRLTVTKNDLGTLATSVQVSVPRGLLLKAGWQLKVKGQERIAERGASRVADRTFTTHEMIEFREEADLDPARIAASTEAAIKKGAEFLKKQQKPAGAWTGTRVPEVPGETISLSGLAVRALLAAGVPADDPALVAAAKSLRVAPPQETTALTRQIVALSLKMPTVQEKDEILKLCDELLKRREPRTHLWSAGGRNDSPDPISTARALEALALAPDPKVPDEVWKSAIEFFTTATQDEEKEVELDLEFEKDAATIAADPKKVLPVAWLVDAGGRRGGFMPGTTVRRGSYFVLVAAMNALLIAAPRLTLDEKQRQAVDTALRKGLANLQARWTVRTVPPVEAAWCGQRIEYQGSLGPMLARAKLDRISKADWRLETATMLLREQGEDGSWWPGTEQALVKTAYALLMLAEVRKP
jgi:hypothetical protein